MSTRKKYWSRFFPSWLRQFLINFTAHFSKFKLNKRNIIYTKILN